MFMASVALTALILALVVRRPVARLADRRFRRAELLWLGVALHLAFVPPVLNPLLSITPLPGLPPVGGVLYVFSLSLLAVFAWLNRGVPGVLLIGLGLLMNALVIALNCGRMPVDPGLLEAKGDLEEMLAMEAAGRWSTWTIMGEDTLLSFLGDWLLVPRPIVGPGALSPGDIVIAAGVVFFFMVIPEAAESPRGSWG